VILAGGKGSRLAPYTAVIPKPLMPLGDRPILDVVIRQLAHHGFDRVTIAVGYLAHLIQAVLGDGSEQGVQIDYHLETEPLGTAGPLATIADHESLLAMNGDLLTDLDYGAFYAAHKASGNAMSVAVHRRVVQNDYGVLHLADGDTDIVSVTGYEEKPKTSITVSMGVYAIEPEALAMVPAGRFDIPDLVVKLLDEGMGVGAYPFEGYWLDIGRPDDYDRAQAEFAEILPRLLPGGLP